MREEGFYQSVILDLRQVQLVREDYETGLATYDSLWTLLEKRVHRKGSLWILGRNLFDQELLPLPLDLVHRIELRTDFKLRNVLVVYQEQSAFSSKHSAAAHYLIPFLVKTADDYYFDKDSIREPHVFKDIEWGKRIVGKSGYSEEEKPRYSPKGRDPGNVFYRTLRNGEGHVMAINGYADEEIYEKLVKTSTKKDWLVASNITSLGFKRVVEGLGRRLAVLETPT